MVNTFCRLILILILGAFSACESYGAITRFIMVVPVYRELYNGNLQRLLDSIANLETDQAHPCSVDLVFNVNNTEEVVDIIREENQASLQFLRNYRNARFKIHVIDNTKPGYAVKAIGRVRDDATQYALSMLKPEELQSAVVAQMDADTIVSFNYLSEIQHAFLDPAVEFALASIEYQVERHAKAEMFKRSVVSRMESAAHGFYRALLNYLPVGGGPRIISRAQAILTVGGVPIKTGMRMQH